MKMSGMLDGKVAVITGGTSGIGLASVERFVDQGAKVVIGDIQDDLGKGIQERLGDSVVYCHADVTLEADIAGLVETAASHFGRLDAMFNNAGAQGDPSGILEFEAEGLDKTLALLTRSVALGHKHAALQFKRQQSGGSIISTASAAAQQGGWSSLGYTAGKHAVIGVVRQAVAELAQFGIRSNAIAPGVILTPIMARSFGVPMDKASRFEAFMAERLGPTQPMRRLGLPEDVADVALFLASDLSRYMAGAVIPVDGGATSITQGSFATDITQAASEFNTRFIGRPE